MVALRKVRKRDVKKMLAEKAVGQGEKKIPEGSKAKIRAKKTPKRKK